MTIQPLGIEGPELLALNMDMEAANQGPVGMAAVGRVTLNRTRRKFESDGTIEGTVLGDNQFSWTQYTMVGGVYTKVAHTPAQEIARVHKLYAAASLEHGWPDVLALAEQVMAGTYHALGYDLLTDDTVAYFNPKLVKKDPPWAKPSCLVARIQDHWFYRDPGPGAAAARAA